MKWRVVLPIIALLVIGMWWMTPSRNSWRYKMGIEIQTPEGVRTGSAVREVKYDPGDSFWIAQGRPQWRVRGEAIAVDLPGGRTVYALLVGNDRNVDYAARITDMALSDDGRVHGRPAPVSLYPRAPDKPVLQNVDPLPMLVIFTDPKDPKSVERVDPRNVSGTLGPGYALRSVTLQITRETVTTGIEKRLPPWFMQLVRERANLSGQTSGIVTTNNLSDELGPGSFSTEIRR